MKTFHLYYDKEKEEQYLDQMCQKGWALSSFFLGVYTFEPCEPGKYIYQVDMPQMPSGTGSRQRAMREYIDFVESTGAECVCTWGFYVIFRKESSQGEFKLYTDADSQIRHWQRIRKLFLVILIWDIFACFLNTYNFLIYVWDWKSSPYADGNLLHLDGALILLCGLGIVYLITLVFSMMVIRFTRKIHRLKQERDCFKP